MLTSYTLELTSFEGLQVNFNQSQKDTFFETVNIIKRVSTAIQSNKATADISLYTKNIEILVNTQNDFNDIDNTLAFLLNSSSLTENSTEASKVVSIITNYTTTLQSLGRMRDNNQISK